MEEHGADCRQGDSYDGAGRSEKNDYCCQGEVS